MFYCKECGFEFNKPKRILEGHGFTSPPFEEIFVCPNCYSEGFVRRKITHCRCCGARIIDKGSRYCSARCKERGERLYALELKRRKLREESPINEIIKKLKEYNELNNTNYSYGQYVALILSKERQ